MPKHTFLVQLDCEADELDVQKYVGDAISCWIGGNPDLDDPLHALSDVRVDAVEIEIKRK